MDDTRALTIVDSDPRAIGAAEPGIYHPAWSLELAIAQWLDAKHKRSQSARTRGAYAETLQAFRAALQSQGFDLDSVQSQADRQAMQVTRDKVKQLAQLFAGFSKRGGQVKQATINHRLAVLSSFYAFCIKQEWLDYNPIEHLERSKVEAYTDVKALPFDDIAAMFERFDMSKAEDVRDAALLAIALQTGHRVTELAQLRWKHVSVHKGIVTLFFERCKGGKSASDELDALASKALMRWLHRYYGAQLGKLPAESPLWVSLARGSSRGQKLSIQAIGQICKKWTGTAHVHRLRNTFAMGMLETGASLREVSGKLLHGSLATTSLYIDRLQSAKNTHAGDLAKLFNIK